MQLKGYYINNYLTNIKKDKVLLIGKNNIKLKKKPLGKDSFLEVKGINILYVNLG